MRVLYKETVLIKHNKVLKLISVIVAGVDKDLHLASRTRKAESNQTRRLCATK